MDSLFIEATSLTPVVDFRNNGDLLLEGKSCPIHVNKFYDPMLLWIDGINVKRVNFNIHLEYINSASIKKIFLLLKHLDLNRKIEEININWHYEEGDDDTFETGIILDDLFRRLHFNYYGYTEAV
jgi:hypothetical protein